jgi:hypothetical protein
MILLETFDGLQLFFPRKRKKVSTNIANRNTEFVHYKRKI